MAKQTKAKNVAYVVWAGRTLGIFEKWMEAHESVRDYSMARYAGFSSYEAAEEAWERFEDTSEVPSWDDVKELQHTPLADILAIRRVRKALDRRVRMLITTFERGDRDWFECPSKSPNCGYPTCMC